MTSPGTYNLGPVKPLTEQAAYLIGPMFGIETVYGWREKDQFPDHPSGHALDFMIPNLETGDALADFVIEHADALGVKYIVWNRRSWNAQRKTWEPYTSTSNPHTDHVHVTFNDQNDGTVLSTLKGIARNIPTPFGAAATLVDVLRPIGIAGSNLIAPVFWRRIGMGVLGTGLLIAGLIYLNKRTIGNVARGVSGLAGTAIQGAAFGAGAGATGGLGGSNPAPVTAVPSRPGPRPPAINAPSNAPTTSPLPPELYAPVSSGGTYTVTTAKGTAKRPASPLPDSSGVGGKPYKRSRKGAAPGVSAPVKSNPYGSPGK